MLNQIKDALKKLFGFVDANKDGKVDLAEITAAVDKAEDKFEEVKAVEANSDRVQPSRPRYRKDWRCFQLHQ